MPDQDAMRNLESRRDDSRKISKMKREGKDIMSLFVCVTCKESLFGKRFVKINRKPMCVTCYNDQFTSTCVACKEKIDVDGNDIQYQEDHWHLECFHCQECHTDLFGKTFGLHEEDMKTYCADCYNRLFKTWCDNCHQPFKGGSKMVIFNKKNLHKECFTCTHCKRVMEVSDHRLNDGLPYCLECYEELFAPKCQRCKASIMENTNGVVYNEAGYHVDCLTCDHCQIPLNQTRFVEYSGHLHCFDCFEKPSVFGKECSGCGEKITGADSDKFYTVEDQTWHLQCFNCARCHKNIDQEEFVSSWNDSDFQVYCQLCGAENAMDVMQMMHQRQPNK